MKFQKHYDVMPQEYSLYEVNGIGTLASDVFRPNIKMVNSLNGQGTTSFESTEKPGFYLRHQGGQLKLHKFANNGLFRADASFTVEDRTCLVDRIEYSHKTFNAVNFPTTITPSDFGQQLYMS